MKEINIVSEEIVDKIQSLRKTIKKLIAGYSNEDLQQSSVRDSFLNELKVIMAIDHITDFRFVAKEGKVQSVILLNLPFLNDIEIDLT